MALRQTFNPLSGTFDQVSDLTLAAAAGSTPNAAGASISSSQVLTLQPANASFPGIISTTTQDIPGAKTFLEPIEINSDVTYAHTTYNPIGALSGSNPAWETGFRTGQPYYSIVLDDGTTKTTYVDFTLNGISSFSSIVSASSFRANTISDIAGGSVMALDVAGQGLHIETNTDEITTRIKGNSTQTSDIFQIVNSADALLVRVNNSGNMILTGTIAASNFSGSSSGTNTGDVTLAAVGAAPSANGATLTGQVLNLEPADATHPGVVTTGAQTFAGAKTFSSTIVGSISGNAANVTGVVAIANGGTGQTTANAGFNALSPMTTGGDLIYGGASGIGTRLANGSAGQVLTSHGTTTAPTWETPGAGSYTVPTVQTFTSGSGTYTRPTSPTPLYIRVVMVGGGGGGGGSASAAGTGGGGGAGAYQEVIIGSPASTYSYAVGAAGTGGAGSGADGTDGTDTTFDSNIAGLGVHGVGTTGSNAGGAGGTNTVATGTAINAVTGGTGCSGFSSGTAPFPGGAGGQAPFFCGGAPNSGLNTTPFNAVANTGGGGAGGDGGGNPGSNGAAGKIVVIEYYQ